MVRIKKPRDGRELIGMHLSCFNHKDKTIRTNGLKYKEKKRSIGGSAEVGKIQAVLESLGNTRKTGRSWRGLRESRGDRQFFWTHERRGWTEMRRKPCSGGRQRSSSAVGEPRICRRRALIGRIMRLEGWVAGNEGRRELCRL
jgi:hypothetical protein